MGAELLETSKVFQESISACAKVLKPYNIDLHQEFRGPGGWREPAHAMAGLTALQVRDTTHPSTTANTCSRLAEQVPVHRPAPGVQGGARLARACHCFIRPDSAVGLSCPRKKIIAS